MTQRRTDAKLHTQGRTPIRSFRRENMSQSEMTGMDVKKAWRLAREHFPEDEDARTEEYRRLLRGDKDGD